MSLEIGEINYETVRKSILLANVQAKGRAPCQNRAECCVSTVPITEGDINVIQKYVLSGEIPAGVVEAALRNAANPNRTKCPFLSKDKQCSIYEFRPLACIEFGFGGVPTSRVTGREVSISVRQLKQDATLGACGSCRKDMLRKNVSLSISCLGVANATSLYVGVNKVQNIQEFVKSNSVFFGESV